MYEYVHRQIVARSVKHFVPCKGNNTFFCIVVGVDVAVKYMKAFNVAMVM